MFQYSPGEIADLSQAIGGAASHLESIKGSALNTLISVREEFEGAGGGSFEQIQLLINSGIEKGQETCTLHANTVTHVLDEMVNTDLAAGQSFGGF